MYEHENTFDDDTMMTSTCDAERLNTLLRGELSAVETYELALSRLDGNWATTTLHHIHNDHLQAVMWLRDRIRQAGTEPLMSPGLWGPFASMATDTAATLGPATALAALKQGEQCTMNEYEESIRCEDVEPECKNHIQSRLLPQCEGHILELDHLMAQNEPCRHSG